MWLKEKLRRLNGWQRIGVVLSVVWVLGAANYQRNADIDRAEKFSAWAYQNCTESKSLRHDYDFGECSSEFEKNWEIWLQGSWGNVAFISLAPIPLGWGMAYLLVAIGHWVGAGFKKK